MVSTDDLACTYRFHHLMACVDRIRMFLQNIHNHVYTGLYGVLTQTKWWILTTTSTSKPLPKIIKNWNIDGNVTLGKLNYRTTVYVVTQYLISHTFPTLCEHLHITSEQFYIWRLNTVIYGVWTLLYMVSEHCYILHLNTYILHLNTVIYCIWTLIHCIWTLLYILSEHCYILRLNTVI